MAKRCTNAHLPNNVFRASIIHNAARIASRMKIRVTSAWLADRLGNDSAVIALACRDAGMTPSEARDAIEGMSWPRLVAAVAKAAR